MHTSSKKRFKQRQRIRCKIQSLLNKHQPNYCFHNEYVIKRGNFLLQNKLKKSKTQKQIKKICQKHSEDFHRQMKKYSLNQLTKRIFEALNFDEIEEVLDDPIFFFRDQEKLLLFIRKRIRTLGNKYLKKKKPRKMRRVETEVSNRVMCDIYKTRNYSSRKLFQISPQTK